MKFTFNHNNINVKDLDKSISFYKDTLGLDVVRYVEAPDGRYKIAFLSDGSSMHRLELTWLRDWEKDGYDLGDNEMHLAFMTDDFEAAYEKHKNMGVICFENKEMGIYFIADPDDYWMEVIPPKK